MLHIRRMGRMKMLLIIDDEINIRVTLKEYLEEEGYESLTAATAEEALRILKQKNIRVVISDLKMPGMNGLDLLKLFKKENPQKFTQFIMITGFNDTNTMRLGFKEGAIDYLYKPVTLEEVKSAVEKGLEKYMVKFTARQSWSEDKQRLVTAQDLIKKKHMDMIQLMLKMIQIRDKVTEEHSKRVMEIANIIAGKMGLNTEETAKIKLAALLHDVGKISVPDAMLLKPGRLTIEEFEKIKQHSRKGYEIVKDYVSKDIAEIILYHHEQFCGHGYPVGLVGYSIPLGSRIIIVADEYDALRNKRPYRNALSKNEAVRVMINDAQKFDPKILNLFLDEIEMIEKKLFPDSRINLNDEVCARG
ncbi:MAG: HD domain-containing phosphohydrolase [Peptococcaceae bacterium]